MSKILAVLPTSDQFVQFGGFAQRYGHIVLGATSSRRTRELLSEHRVDIVVAPVDFEYGEILSVMRESKENPKTHGTTFVLFAEAKHGEPTSKMQQLSVAVKALGADKLVTFPYFHAAELWWQVAVMLPDDLQTKGAGITGS